MNSMFKPATREQLKLRLALDGPSGSGKTYTALRFAFALVGPSGRVAVIDSEHRSASKYIGESPDGIPWQFDVCELANFAPTTYTAVVEEAGRAGYDVLIIDSLSHAWQGAGGALDIVDRKGGNKFTDGWREVTPMHNRMIDAMLATPLHLIVTMRTKMEYVVEINEKGKSVPRKVGTAPIQRQGMEYEFDIVVDLDHEHVLKVSKSRCSGIDGRSAVKPGPEFVAPIRDWLSLGERPAPVQSVGAAQPTPAQPAVPYFEPPAPPESFQTDPHAVNTNGYASPAQIDSIKELAQQLGWPVEALREIIGKRGANRLAELSWHDANEIEHKMRSLWIDQGVDQIAGDEVPF